jgi:hypothetical protein
VITPVESPWNEYPPVVCLPNSPDPLPAAQTESESPETPVFLDYGRDI